MPQPQPQREIITEAVFECRGRRTTLAAWRNSDGTVRYTVNGNGVSREDFSVLVALCSCGHGR